MRLVQCNECGTVVSEAHLATQRGVCGSCGSSGHRIALAADGTLRGFNRLYDKRRTGATGSAGCEVQAGDHYYVSTDEWRKMRRVFNREEGWYSERLWDPVSGRIFFGKYERLSSKNRSGAAKRRDRPSRVSHLD
jgi:hypothetical protein